MNTSTSRDITQCAIDSSRYCSVLPRSPFAPGSGWKIRADTPIRSVRCVMRWPARSNSRRARAAMMRPNTDHGVSLCFRYAGGAFCALAGGGRGVSKSGGAPNPGGGDPGFDAAVAAVAAAGSAAVSDEPGAPGSVAVVTGDAPSSATSCAAAAACAADVSDMSVALAGVERGESEEADEVPGRPAGEGVFSLMTMVWCVAHAGR